MGKTKALLLLLASSLLLFACDDGGGEEKIDITQQEVTAGLQTNLETNVVGLAQSAKFLDSSKLAEEMAVGAQGLTPVEDDVSGVDGQGGGEEISLDFTQDARELVDMLMDNVFIDANIVDSSATSVTYKLSADFVCEDDYYDTGVDPDCVEALDQYNVRFKVSSSSAGDLDIDLLIGDSDRVPLSFEIYAQHLAISANLGDLRAVLESMAADSGEEVELPSMKGKVRAEIKKEADQVFSLTWGVTDAIEVEMEGMEIKIAKAAEAVSMRVDGAAKTITYSVNWGAVSLDIPGEFFESDSMTCTTNPTGEPDCYEETSGGFDGLVELDLAGLTGSAIFDANADALNFTNLSIGNGPATFAVAGDTIFSLEVNKDAGRSFDLSATVAEDGESARVEISPSLEILAVFNMAAVADQMEDLEDWMLNNTLGMSLTNNPVIEFAETGLMVVQGDVSMWSNGATLDASGPVCVYEDDEGEFTDPMAAMTTAAECPAVDVEEPVPAPEP